jgi:hypothetical protein
MKKNTRSYNQLTNRVATPKNLLLKKKVNLYNCGKRRNASSDTKT